MSTWLKELFWRSAEFEENQPGSVPVESAKAPPNSGVLAGLRDVEGVIGSLALTRDGGLVGQDLPHVLDEATVRRLATRLSQLGDALLTSGGDFESSTLHFENYQLHLGLLSPGLIGVVTEERVNQPALNMALRVAARRLASEAPPAA